MAGTEDEASIAALSKTKDAIKQIKSALIPFLQALKEDKACSQSVNVDDVGTSKKRDKPDSDAYPKLDAHSRAEAQAAVALAIGTLRYMGARLRGLDEGRKKGDPLRVELDKIRAKLMDLKKLEATNQSSSEEKGSSEQNEVTNDSKQKKRRKILDTNASERMIKGALNGK